MDYEGQKLSELFFFWIITSFGGIGWIIGYMQQDFTIVFQSWLVGVLISMVLCVPDWPFYNRHPIQWLESVPDRRQEYHELQQQSLQRAEAKKKKELEQKQKKQKKG